MGTALARRIVEYRKMAKLTQDQYGRKYGVSGPAIFKFEKGFVAPSLPLWLKFTRDNELSDRRAVLIWIQDKLPDDYKKYADPDASSESEDESDKRHNLDYTVFDDRDAMRCAILVDDSIPLGLKDLIRDDETWSLYKPTGEEINFLRSTYGNLGPGAVDVFVDALRVARTFLSYGLE